jgi:hypothetical protein
MKNLTKTDMKICLIKIFLTGFFVCCGLLMSSNAQTKQNKKSFLIDKSHFFN